ncbi:MBL fold metallo-hydrolase [Alkalicoccus luteus]|uniref:MBL fold metallo-hydrolase n=1 Tax=Alkalicoccus luteus TaxID=1237094 RepID=UPI0040349612
MLRKTLTVGLAAATAAAIAINMHPGFGQAPGKAHRDSFKDAPNLHNGRFHNKRASAVSVNPCDLYTMTRDLFRDRDVRSPFAPLAVQTPEWDKDESVTWFGHSSYYVHIDDIRLLVDPMFGPAAAPLPGTGSKRYTGDLLSMIPSMPDIDAVLITHDHYDHLDYPTIQALLPRVKRFIVPLGVASHLIRWGVSQERIQELNWWEETYVKDVKVALTPSHHFSGRTMAARDRTLWGGWVIAGSESRLYISGDGGYGSHFREIGDVYGPFDLAVMEGGQYDSRWEGVHMTPEEAVQAFEDVRGRSMMLSHWAGFTLSFHSWEEPAERALAEAERKDVNLLTPHIGETTAWHAPAPQTNWWRQPAYQ